MEKPTIANIPTIDEQVALLMRGAEFGDRQIAETMARELRERLLESERTGRPLRVYCGYDPTAPDIHLGHTVTMRKLRQFQDLGHEVTFLIGTGTGLVGDASDKNRARPRADIEQLLENARSYAEQALRVLDRERTRVRYNAEWLTQLTLVDVIRLASNFTVQQFLARDNFHNRYTAGDAIGLHEFFYALMQGYDAVMLETDVQIGGTEQLFNLLAGRKIQEAFGQRPQVCITLPILVGTDGHVRMSKSIGNYVGVAEPPETQYGKAMSIPDAAMRNWFELASRWTQAQIDTLLEAVERSEVHPMEAKKQLAWEIVDIFHGRAAADAAAEQFARVHQQRQLPADMPELVLEGPENIVDLMDAAGLIPSKSQGRRLVQQGAVRLDGTVVRDVAHQVQPGQAEILQVGKRHFVRLVERMANSE